MPWIGTEGDARAVRLHAGDRRIERLDLEAVDAHHRVAVVQQVVREGEARGAHADYQHALARRGLRKRTAQVERVPAREERVDLESPGQPQHVLQRARLRLGDVDRVLALVDARLHAVVADAVAGARRGRVVHHDHRERAHRPALALELVELRDALLERAAVQGYAEGALLEFDAAILRRFLLESLRARVLALLVAPDAVVGLVERARKLRAGIRQAEAFAPTDVVQGVNGIPRVRVCLHGDQMERIHALGRVEQHAVAISPAALGRVRGPRAEALRGRERRRVRRLFGEPCEHLLREQELVERAAQKRRHFLFERRPVERLRLVGLDLEHRPALHELALHAEERREAMVAVDEILPFLLDREERGDEAVEVRCDRDQQLRLGLALEGVRARAGLAPAGVQEGLRVAQPGRERLVHARKTRGLVEILEREAEGEPEEWFRCGHCGKGRQRVQFYRKRRATSLARRQIASFAIILPQSSRGERPHEPS